MGTWLLGLAQLLTQCDQPQKSHWSSQSVLLSLQGLVGQQLAQLESGPYISLRQMPCGVSYSLSG